MGIAELLLGIERLLIQYEASGSDLGQSCIGADEAAKAILLFVTSHEALGEAIRELGHLKRKRDTGLPDLNNIVRSELGLAPD
jgi:hypothetical protein